MKMMGKEPDSLAGVREVKILVGYSLNYLLSLDVLGVLGEMLEYLKRRA
jgi:hypothetical protein